MKSMCFMPPERMSIPLHLPVIHARKTGNGCVFKDGMEKLNPMACGCRAGCVCNTIVLFRNECTDQSRIRPLLCEPILHYGNSRKKPIVLATCGDTEDWTFDAIKAPL